MENLQYVQKKMTMSFNRKYTSDVTYSFLFPSNIYYLQISSRQYKTSLHTRCSHSVTANTKQSLHTYTQTTQLLPNTKQFLNTRAAVFQFKHTQYEHVESEKARMYNTEHFSEI